MNKVDADLQGARDTFEKLKEQLDLGEIVDVDTTDILIDEDGVSCGNIDENGNYCKDIGVIKVGACLKYFQNLELKRVLEGKKRRVYDLGSLARAVAKTILEMEKEDPVGEIDGNDYYTINRLEMGFLRFYKVLKSYMGEQKAFK